MGGGHTFFLSLSVCERVCLSFSLIVTLYKALSVTYWSTVEWYAKECCVVSHSPVTTYGTIQLYYSHYFVFFQYVHMLMCHPCFMFIPSCTIYKEVEQSEALQRSRSVGVCDGQYSSLSMINTNMVEERRVNEREKMSGMVEEEYGLCRPIFCLL